MASLQQHSLWHNRDFLLLWSGQAVSNIGSQVSLLAFPWLILSVTHSPFLAGLIAATRLLPYLLFGLVAGALVDRWNRKCVMIVCDIGRAIALGSIPIAYTLGWLTGVQLFIVSFIEGTLFIFFGLAEMASLLHVVPQEQFSDALAQSMVIDSVVGLIGPSLSGMFYALGNIVPFLADALSYTASVVSLLFIKKQFQEKRTVTTQKLWSEIREGTSWLWQHPVIRFLALLNSVLNFCCIGYTLVVLVFAQEQHASKIAIGLIFAAGGLGSIVGAFMIGPLTRRFRFEQRLIWATWIWVITWLCFLIAPNPLVLGIVTAASFIIVPIHSATQYNYRLTHIPDRLQGRVNSVYRIALFESQMLGLLVTGLLLQLVGPIYTVLILFVPQAVMAVATQINPHLRSKNV
ncbi:MAG: MFS transporter [Ktedonobacteraceae bacterium]